MRNIIITNLSAAELAERVVKVNATKFKIEEFLLMHKEIISSGVYQFENSIAYLK